MEEVKKKYYAKFDTDGFAQAFYCDDYHDENGIPKEATEITEAQWNELITFPWSRRWDGSKVVEYTPPSPELNKTRTSYLSTIDNQAEKERLAHITPGVGQSMTYARKVEEAKAFLADPEGEYPMLSASVGIDGDSLEQVAQIVLNLDYQWSLIGAHIESVRLAAKRDVNEATTVSEIESIVNNLNWSVE